MCNQKKILLARLINKIFDHKEIIKNQEASKFKDFFFFTNFHNAFQQRVDNLDDKFYKYIYLYFLLIGQQKPQDKLSNKHAA